jgi:hypothetical protein
VQVVRLDPSIRPVRARNRPSIRAFGAAPADCDDEGTAGWRSGFMIPGKPGNWAHRDPLEGRGRRAHRSMDEKHGRGL